MGVAGGVNNLAWLFTGTLIVMLLLNVPFSALVKFLPRKQFISLSYRFFALSILAFGAALYFATTEQAVWVGRFFFIWISVFNLFVVSIFWSLVVDIFSPEQGKRLFGFIAAGATLGAIVGSSFTASLAQTVQPAILLIGSAALLEVATWCVRQLSRLSARMSDRPHPEREEEPIGGGVMAGFVDAIRSPYLLNTAIFLLLYAVTSTFLYFSQASVVSSSFARSRRANDVFCNDRSDSERHHAFRSDLPYGSPRTLVWGRDRAVTSASREHARFRSHLCYANATRGCDFPGRPSRRQFRANAACTAGSIYRCVARGSL